MSSPQADDSAIGDADHGINMARDITAVINKLDDTHQAHPK
jgi:dihydroxyacetone kinase